MRKSALSFSDAAKNATTVDKLLTPSQNSLCSFVRGFNGQKNRIIFEYDTNTKRIVSYLAKIDQFFVPRLSSNVNIEVYSLKLSKNAIVFFACYKKNDIGMVAFYLNFENKITFITSISILPDYQKMGTGKRFLKMVERISKTNGISEINLEVKKVNISAQKFYEKHKFLTKIEKEGSWILQKYII